MCIGHFCKISNCKLSFLNHFYCSSSSSFFLSGLAQASVSGALGPAGGETANMGAAGQTQRAYPQDSNTCRYLQLKPHCQRWC